MNNIILLYSPVQRVGKTTLSDALVSRGIVNKKDSFAVYIKKLSYDLHKAVSYLSITKDEFYQTRKDEKILSGKSPRDLVCAVSDLIQNFYGTEIWGQVVYDDLLAYTSKEENKQTIIIDDWRRLVESNYLIKQNTFNIIKVYLDKKGKKEKPSQGSAHYEGQIKPEDCDIVFTYEKDYSNFEELIGLLENAIK